MAVNWVLVATISSSLQRFFCYMFLRWVPGHNLWPIACGAYFVYTVSVYCIWAKSISKDEKKSPGTARQKSKGGSKIKTAAAKTPNSTDRLSDPGILYSIFTGVPTTKSKSCSIATFLVNVILLIGVQDVVLRAPLLHTTNDLSFARVGYVDDDSARFLLREPDSSSLPVRIFSRADADENWTEAATIQNVTELTDFTKPVLLPSLKHSTRYHYKTSNGHSGSFYTAPLPGKNPTAPSSRLTFLSTSCIKPHFPYSPFDHPLKIPGLHHLAKVLPSLSASFMLFLGDFIYIDVPFRWGSTAAAYRPAYREVYASPSFPAVSKDLPWIHVIDDHEIANDWDKGPFTPPYPEAIDAWRLYHHSANPDPSHPNATYYSFNYGPASFFLLDTRSYRSASSPLPATHFGKTMLGERQLDALLAWFKETQEGVRWKIIVSSVPFTRNWRVNGKDTWGGYLAERQMLLETMWDLSSPASSSKSGKDPVGFIILSGDRHEFGATKFPAPAIGDPHTSKGQKTWPKGTAVYEFSCSPLNMFYLPILTYKEKKGEQSGVGAGGEDIMLHYVNKGNSKFGSVSIQNVGKEKAWDSELHYSLYVDGEEKWERLLTIGKEGITDLGAQQM